MEYKYDDRFRNADGTESRVTMLNGSEDIYLEDRDFTGFMKPYRNKKLSFMALLPKQEGAEALREAVGRVDFSKLYRKSSYQEVHTKMPEFSFEYTRELKPLCKTRGISRLFTDNADFSPVSDTPLKVDSILHKAYIDVNQDGTRAAAFTAAAVALGLGCNFLPVKIVILDRLFIFAIAESDSGIPLFAGIVNHLQDITGDPEQIKRERRRNRKIRMIKNT